MKWFFKYFIPHHDNDRKPHLFRERTVLVLVVFVIGVEFVVMSAFFSIHQTGYFLSSIVPTALVDLTNQERTTEKIPTLKTNESLNKAAQAKAEDMVQKGYFAHSSPDGVTPWDWIAQSGYVFDRAGENLAVDFNDSADVVTAWMNSPLHRKNIMNGGFTEVGIGLARGRYQGRDAIFVVQMFGTPIISQKTITPISKAPLPPTHVVLAKTKDNAIRVAGKNTNAPAHVLAEEIAISPLADTPSPTALPEAFFSKLFLSPNRFLAFAYLIAAFFVAFPLMTSLVLELKRGHLRHIMYGTVLFAVLIALVLINQYGAYGEILLV